MSKKKRILAKGQLLLLSHLTLILIIFVSLYSLFVPKTTTYTEPNNLFTVSYPTSWRVTELSEKDIHVETSLLGLASDDAQIHIFWGNGLGGACPEELQAEEIILNEVRVQCHYIQEGVEYWRLMSAKDKMVNFSADASSPVSSPKREDIEEIIKSLHFF